MRHIGFDARLPAFHRGGISTWIVEMLRSLQAEKTGHRLTILESHRAQRSNAGRFTRATLHTPCHHRLESLTLSAELLPRRLDLLHSPDFIPPLRGAKHHVITIHDLNFLHFPQFQTAASRRYYAGQIRRAARQADHIMTVSRASQHDIQEFLDVPAQRITVHYHGVSESFTPLPACKRAELRRQLDLPETFLLFVGTFEPRKNVMGLLEAWLRLREQLPDAPPVVLAGRRGWLFDDTRRRIANLQLDDRVIWREDVPRDSLPALYSLATALILPSFYEGFGLPALEAMACGTVPIVSNLSSLPEVVGNVGVKVDPRDTDALAEAMLHALTDSDWRCRQEAEGLQRAAAFTWERSARALLAAWDGVLNQH